MIRTVIVEDEFFGQEFLKKVITDNFPDISIVGVCDHVEDAVKKINELLPQLVLMDVEILGGTGFDVLKRLHSKSFKLIFITAYSEYAIDAIKNHAFDYILKPVNIEEFKQGVQKAISQIRKKRETTAATENRMSVNTSSGIVYFETEQILYLEADGPYTSIVTADSKTLSSKSIGEYEKKLPNYPFYRTHHSFIVNLINIEKFEKGRTGTLIMKNGDVIPVSQRKMTDFVRILEANDKKNSVVE